MQYENLFWGMATIVVVAIFGGALWALAKRRVHSLGGCILLAVVNCCAAIYLTRGGGFADQADLLAFAAFLFTLVISVAATLAMRRLLQR